MNEDITERLWQTLWSLRKPNEGEHIRFELGGEEYSNMEQPVPRFLQAFMRARMVADNLFGEDLVGVVAWHPQDTIHYVGEDKIQNGFDALEKTGFKAMEISRWSADVYPDPKEETVKWELRSFNLNSGRFNRDCLIWASIANEMAILPAATVLTWLLSSKSELMLHIYDDRGMDVIAMDTHKLKPIHNKFHSWLLDYDRGRMRKLF